MSTPAEMNLVQQQPVRLAFALPLQQSDVSNSASKIYYLAAALFATSIAVVSYLVSSQGIAFLGGVFLASKLVDRFVSHISNYHTDPKVPSADKVRSYMDRSFWKSLALMSAFLGICGNLKYGLPLWSIVPLTNTQILQRVAFGAVFADSLRGVVRHAENAYFHATSAEKYQKALFPLYDIVGMASSENQKEFALLRNKAEALIDAVKTNERIPILEILRDSLLTAKNNREEISPKLVCALLDIYMAEKTNANRVQMALEMAAADSGLKLNDLYKHLVRLVCDQEENIEKLELSVEDLCTYLPEDRFRSYFNLEQVESSWATIDVLSLAADSAQWRRVEGGIVENGRKTVDSLKKFMKRTMRVSSVDSESRKVNKLKDYRLQTEAQLSKFQKIYPNTLSCVKLSKELDDEKFKSFFLLNGPFTLVSSIISEERPEFARDLATLSIEEGLAWALDDVLLRIIVRTETLPTEPEMEDMEADVRDRLAALIDHRERANELRQILLNQYPVLESFEAFRERGFFLNTNGLISPLDEEIKRRNQLEVERLSRKAAALEEKDEWVQSPTPRHVLVE